MGMFARRKGRAAEQELARLLRASLGDLYRFQRNTLQSDQGGDDFDTDAPFSFEVKRVEKPSWTAWVKQALEQARRHRPPKVAVIAHRANHEQWTFTLCGLSGAEFCRVVRALKLFNDLPKEQQLRLLAGSPLLSEGTNAAE